jgi:hypothetical protein
LGARLATKIRKNDSWVCPYPDVAAVLGSVVFWLVSMSIALVVAVACTGGVASAPVTVCEQSTVSVSVVECAVRASVIGIGPAAASCPELTSNVAM